MFDLSPSSMIADTAAKSGNGLLAYAVMFIGLFIAKPLFVLIMTSVEFRNPLSGASGRKLVFSSLGMIAAAYVIVHGPTQTIMMVKRDYVHPMMIHRFAKDTCNPRTARCDVVFLENGELLVMPWDKVPDRASPTVTRPHLRPASFRARFAQAMPAGK